MENDLQATLSQMRKDFIERLPERIAFLKSLLADVEEGKPESLETLYRTAHSLVGAAGVHRLMLVSDAARQLEQIVAQVDVEDKPTEHRLDDMRLALADLEAHMVNPSHCFVPQIQGGWTEIPRIVVVDDDKEQADWLRSVLEQAGYQVKVFHELALFVAADLLTEPPSAVIMDMIFPEGDDAGARVIEKLKEQSLTGFPVIFTSVRQDMPAKLAAYRAGATRYLTKPLDVNTLLRVVADSAALTPKQPFCVLLVDDDPDQLKVHSMILRQVGMTVLEEMNPLRVPEVLETGFKADVLVMDMYMPACSGPELAAILHDDQRYAEIPIVYLSAETCIAKQLLALNRGGDHFLTKPVDPRHLVATVALHGRRFRQEREQAETIRATLYERERHQQALDAHAIVSAADMTGNIVYANDRFCEISSYSREELLGQNHRIIKSDQHPPEFYSAMWQTISQGNIWRGVVCNRDKHGNLYWVETSIVPFMDSDGQPYQYVSIRTDITQIKKTEQRLRIMEQAIDASSSCICIADARQFDNPLIYVNPAFERVTGYSQQEVLGRNARFLQGKETDQPGLNEIRAVLREGRVGEALVHNYRKDGSSYWNDMRIAPVHNEQGQLTHFVGISDDVTERREAGDALRKSEERLSRSQLYANIGTLDWNIKAGTLICSERIGVLFGYPDSQQEVPQNHFFSCVHPDDRQRLTDAIDACVHQGAVFNIEFRCVWPDGSVHWLQERGDVVRSEAGIPQNMLVVVQDITQRKLAELTSTEQQARLQIFKHMIENVADGVVSINQSGAILSFNLAAEKLFGYRATEIIGRNVSLLMPEPYRSEHDSYLARHHAGQSAGIIGKQRELTGQHKDGTIFPLELSITSMEIDKNKHYVGIIRDISERKQHDQELIAARDQAEQANKAKSEFLSSMSHELRTPMNAILGFGQLLEIEANINTDQADYVGEILKAGRHLLELINEVLDLSKIESGTMNLSMELLSCAELVDESVALVKPIAQAQGITINDITVGAYAIRADHTRFKQVLLNLLSNAIKYNRPQGEVRIRADVENGQVRLKISDTGYGIPAARRQELFLPFSRLGAEESDIEGTGVGLTISRRLMNMMGGTVDMESQEGQGSTFWIEIPEVVSEQLSQSNDLGQAMETGTTVGEYRHRVLYIEDNPANLRLVSQILEKRSKVELITAFTPELGLELASAHHPELILLDINLPDMDGYQVLSVLRSLDAVKNTPVIAISANATSRDIERGIAAGFDAYITKPIDIRRFLETVDRLLEEAKR